MSSPIDMGDDISVGSTKRSTRDRGRTTNPPSPTAASKRPSRQSRRAEDDESKRAGSTSSRSRTSVPNQAIGVSPVPPVAVVAAAVATAAPPQPQAPARRGSSARGATSSKATAAAAAAALASANSALSTSAPLSNGAANGPYSPGTTGNSVPINEDHGEEQLFCICRQPYDTRKFMVGCDACEDWFHPRCINITVQEAESLKHFICPPCQKKNVSLNNVSVVQELPSDLMAISTPIPNAVASSIAVPIPMVAQTTTSSTKNEITEGSRKRGRDDSSRQAAQAQAQQHSQQRQQQLAANRQSHYQQQQQQQQQQHQPQQQHHYQQHQSQQQQQHQQQHIHHQHQHHHHHPSHNAYQQGYNPHEVVGQRLATAGQGPGLSALRGVPLGSVSTAGVTPEGIERRRRNVTSDFVMAVRLTAEEAAYSDVESEDDGDIYLSSDDDDDDDAGLTGMGLGDIDVSGPDGDTDAAMINEDDGPLPFGLDAGEYTPPLGITQVLPARALRRPDAPAAALQRIAMMHIREFQNRFESYINSARRLGQAIQVAEPPPESIESLGFGFTPQEIDIEREAPIDITKLDQTNSSEPMYADSETDIRKLDDNGKSISSLTGANSPYLKPAANGHLSSPAKVETLAEKIARIDPGPHPDVLVASMPSSTASAALLFPPLPGIAARVSLTDFTGISAVPTANGKCPGVVMKKLFSLDGPDFILAVDEHPHDLQKLWNDFSFTPALMPSEIKSMDGNRSTPQPESGTAEEADNERKGSEIESIGTGQTENEVKQPNGDALNEKVPDSDEMVDHKEHQITSETALKNDSTTSSKRTGDAMNSIGITENKKEDQLVPMEKTEEVDTSNAIFRGYLSPDDIDEAYLNFLTSRRADAELALVRIEQKKRIMLAGLGYAQRRTLMQTLLVRPLPSTESSLFHGLSNVATIPAPLSGPGSGSTIKPSPVMSTVTAATLGITPHFARPPGYDASGYTGQSSGVDDSLATQKILLQHFGLKTPHDVLDTDLPLRSRLWTDVIPCVGCGGYIPSSRVAKHAIECSLEGSRDLRLTGRFALRNPTLAVCGCPMVPPPDNSNALENIPASAPCSLKVAGRPVYFCPLNREDCSQHILWDSLTKAEIAQLHYLHSARLRALVAEIDAVKRRMRERQQYRVTELEVLLKKDSTDEKVFGHMIIDDGASHPFVTNQLTGEIANNGQLTTTSVGQIPEGSAVNDQMELIGQPLGEEKATFINETFQLAQSLGFEFTPDDLLSLSDSELHELREKLIAMHQERLTQDTEPQLAFKQEHVPTDSANGEPNVDVVSIEGHPLEQSVVTEVSDIKVQDADLA